MKKKISNVIFVLFFLGVFSTSLLAQNQSVISGVIEDEKTGEKLIGVNISIVGTVLGTVTNAEGKFTLTTDLSPPYKIKISMVGYEPLEVEVTEANMNDLNFKMKESGILANEVVVSASRVEESILKSPVSIEKMDIIDMQQTPAPSFYDALAYFKGVDMTVSSMMFQTVNTRGFNSTANLRFVQLIDGMDNQAPGLNFSVGNVVGISELDLESVELMPGAASALYGPNAFNGILLMRSKSPFEYQGLSARVRVGVNHVDGDASQPRPLWEGSIRYAKAFANKLAFKVNVSYLSAEDWHAYSTYNDRDGSNGEGTRETDYGYDGLNIYGDEVSTSINGTTVSRTGYDEVDLVNYNTKSLKFNAALHYRLTKNLEAIVHGTYGRGTTVYTGANRYSLSNFNMFQGKLELRASNFFIRSYMTIEGSGDSYDARFLAININRAWKSDTDWFTDYGKTYATQLQGGATEAQAHAAARAAADAGRLLPGTAEFEAKKDEIQNLVDFKQGAKFQDATRLYHFEGQYDFKNEVKFMDLQAGANYRLYDLNSNGTIFPDTVGNNITYYEFGGYVQGAKRFLNDNLKIAASARFDKNENFQGRVTPRVSAVYTFLETHNIRASFQTGFRNPSSQEQFINLDVGSARLLGGLPDIYAGYEIPNNSFFFDAVAAFGAGVAADMADGLGQGQAVLNNLSTLEAGIVRPGDIEVIRPEQISSFEVGYKSIVGKNLMVDLSYHYNFYRNFLGSILIIKPSTSPDVDLFTAASQVGTSTTRQVFQLYANSKNIVTSQGVSLGLNYSLPRNFSIGANGTWAKLQTVEDDPIIPAFNTPEWKFSVNFGNRKITENLGFNIVWRWQDNFLWESSFGIGDVAAYNSLDLQVSYKIKPIKSILKVGGSNILNNKYENYYGGPTIGALYYVSLTFDELLN